MASGLDKIRVIDVPDENMTSDDQEFMKTIAENIGKVLSELK